MYCTVRRELLGDRSSLDSSMISLVMLCRGLWWRGWIPAEMQFFFCKIIVQEVKKESRGLSVYPCPKLLVGLVPWHRANPILKHSPLASCLILGILILCWYLSRSTVSLKILFEHRVDLDITNFSGRTLACFHSIIWKYCWWVLKKRPPMQEHS